MSNATTHSEAELRLALEVKRLRIALDVCGFTVHFLAVLLGDDAKNFAASQIAAAHEAFRQATGEPSWDQMISERIARREAQCSK